MEIVSLIKTFSGEEWVYPSLNSIYPFVSKIVMVHSNISWTGKTGNRVVPVVKKYIEEKDTEKKIIELQFDTSDQRKQCDHGYQWIKSNLKPDFVMLNDLDEIWDEDNLFKLREWLRNPGKKGKICSYTCRMLTYIKHPRFRIIPPEKSDPVTIVHPKLENLGNNFRGRGLNPKIHNNNIFFHHFNFVRFKLEDIKSKFIESHSSEDQIHIPWEEWKEGKWDKLPHCHNFQPAIGYERNWYAVEIIKASDLPKTVQELDLSFDAWGA